MHSHSIYFKDGSDSNLAKGEVQKIFARHGQGSLSDEPTANDSYVFADNVRNDTASEIAALPDIQSVRPLRLLATIQLKF